LAECLRFNKVVFFDEVAVCWMINTVAQQCWVATGINEVWLSTTF